MGKSITFRGRGRGTSVADPPLDPAPTEPIAVSNAEPRVKFVKGWLTGGTDPADGSVECGPKTLHPLQVTLTQLAELMYRVKDSYVDGSCYTNLGYTVYVMDFASGTTPTDFFSSEDYAIWNRSYVDLGAPPNNTLNERGIWEPHTSPVDGITRPYGYTLNHGMINGCSCYHQSIDGGTGFPPLPSISMRHPKGFSVGSESDTFAALVELAFSGTVAVTGDGNPLNAANEMWVGMEFQALSLDNVSADTSAYSFDDIYSGFVLSGLLTFSLTSGDAICELFSPPTDPPTVAMFQVVPTEWWPYAHPSSPAPYWNRFNGEYLPPFPPAQSSFNSPNNSNIIPLL